jgi:histidinol phosphatase-like PHP family hydrolase
MAVGITNAHIAELLARAAEEAEGQLRMAFKRAARLAFLWPEEVGDLLAANRSLTELAGLGPYLERKIREWLDKPPGRIVPPPERRQFLTLTTARTILAKNPAWAKSYRGDLQMHSEWSDGASSIAVLAKAAAERGYEYIGITDHSKGLKIAGGIDERELARQGKEIATVNKRLRSEGARLEVLHSVEMNLNPQGEGDMERTALDSLDLVVGSFHSALRHKTDQTQRFVAAIENPDVHILGHPRGRIYNFRMGLSADWGKVFARATKLGKAVEIDCYPDRQDLNLDLLKIAREEGVQIAIDTDAHSPEQLGFVELGLAAALQARIEERQVVNFFSLEKLRSWVAALRVRAAG